MSIRYLSEEVAAKIAAGEVIERPSSVVRELVDNALDARSSEITVKLEEAGIKKITVIDNGKGMGKDDLSIALDKHSTSKIQTMDDLYNIKTMGFRGEALYSINNVGKISITSNADHSGMKPGSTISFYNDFSIKPVACKKGTKVEVEDIFYNIPARRKFLKSPLSELNSVKKVLIEKTFSNTEVSFSLYNEKKHLYTTAGDGDFEAAFFQVYKNEEPFSIQSFTEKINEDMEVTVYYSPQDVFFNNRKYQVLFVNSRPVTASFFYSALDAGIRNYISPGRHPLLFVYITINPQLIDVNIHPAKREIKFYNQNDMFGIIQGLLARVYSRDIKRSLAYIPEENPGIQQSFTTSDQNSNSQYSADSGRARALFDSPWDTYRGSTGTAAINDSFSGSTEQQSREDYFAVLTGEDRKEKQTGQNEQIEQINRDYKILGVVFDTYIVIEREGKVYFLDQHAISETFIYHKKKEKYEGLDDTESFVVPVVAQLSGLGDTVLEKIKELNNVGFDIEESEGDSIVIRQVPSFLMNRKETGGIIDLICDFLENQTDFESNSIIDSLLIGISCKEAVKKGDPLNMIEIAELIEKFMVYDMTNCPHGRPVYFELEKENLDKIFQRKK